MNTKWGVLLCYNITMKSVSRWVEFVCFCFALCIAAIMLILRLNGMDAPFIYDEIFSWVTADPAHPFGQVWREVLRADVNVPLFNLILRAWAYVVPMTRVWMRVIPVLFSLLTPVCAWWLAPKTWTYTQKITFCTLLCASFPLTLFSAVLRTYSLAVLLVCIFTLLALQIVQAFIAGQNASKSMWLGFGLAGVLACYSHYFAAALFFITALFVLFASFYYKKQCLWAVGVAVAVGVVWLLWAGPVIYSLFGGSGTGGGDWWFKKGKMLASWEILEFLFGPSPVKLSLLGFLVVGMTSFCFEERPLFENRPEIWLALLQIVGLCGAVGVISFRYNLFIERYFLMILPAVLLFFTGLLMHLQTRWKGVLVLLPLFAGVNMVCFLKIYQLHPTDMSGLTEVFSYVSHTLQRKEVLVLFDRMTYPGPSARWTLEYFLPQDVSLTLTPLTRENVSRMQPPESVPLVAPLSSFMHVMQFSQKYGFDSGSNLRRFKQACLVRTLPDVNKG